jgi:hypothetical protein
MCALTGGYSCSLSRSCSIIGAIWSANIASRKNLDVLVYAVFGFLVPLIGMLGVVAAKRRRRSRDRRNRDPRRRDRHHAAFFIACQKNLGVGWYVVATIIAPIGAFAVVAFEPARIHPVERFRGAR